MDLQWLCEWLGEDIAAAMIGGVVGLVFGAAAQRSQFCLRAATVEFWRGEVGPRLSIWLLVFGMALTGTQMLLASGELDSANLRQIATAGTMSGAILGGALFGIGMVLARGCASRLLVLSATGNLRALLAGLVLTIAAQASLRGILSPAREQLAALWIVPPEIRDGSVYLPAQGALILGLLCLVLALALAWINRVSVARTLWSLAVGGAVVLGWWLTQALSLASFEPVTVQSVSFTGPSADTLMALISAPGVTPSFSLGLVPGVFLGSMLAALAGRDFAVQSFDGTTGVPRYLFGAVLMGFGGMLAGGCAVGAGVTGGSIVSVTAWVALLAMWLSAGLTDWVIDRQPVGMAATA